MFLFYDTETTGKFDFKAPATADHQPNIVELAGMLTDDNLESMGEVNVLIHPQGRWTIPAETTAVHGISTEQCEKYGVPLEDALKMFANLATGAETIVAHNIAFDMAMLERDGMNNLHNFVMQKPRLCTMLKATDICRIPNKWGKNKWPTLQESFKHFYGKEFKGAHRAMADVKACRAVFSGLRKAGAL